LLFERIENKIKAYGTKFLLKLEFFHH